MTRFLGNAVVALVGAVTILALYPTPRRLRRGTRRAADRVIRAGWVSAYAVADWIGDHRHRRRDTP